MDINEYASKRLKELRIKKRISQQELAEELCLTQQQIARYENNQRKFKQDLLFQLASYFDVSINYFFPDTEETIRDIELLEKINALTIEQKTKIVEMIDIIIR